jgi:hypothetical protein
MAFFIWMSRLQVSDDRLGTAAAAVFAAMEFELIQRNVVRVRNQVRALSRPTPMRAPRR